MRDIYRVMGYTMVLLLSHICVSSTLSFSIKDFTLEDTYIVVENILNYK